MPAPEHGPVLIVEDNADLRELLQLVLRTKGHSSMTAEHGQEALKLLKTGALPCLILLDLMMPVMDGFEFRRRQLADPEIASIPVIVFSGHYDSADAAERMNAIGAFQKTGELTKLADFILSHCADLARQ